MGAREYDPTIMRFTSPEPEPEKSGESLNPYVYCKNNPVNYVDPSGKSYHYNLGFWWVYTGLRYDGWRLYNVKVPGRRIRTFCGHNPYMRKIKRGMVLIDFKILNVKFEAGLDSWLAVINRSSHFSGSIRQNYLAVYDQMNTMKYYFRRARRWENRKGHTIGRKHKRD